MFAQATRHCRHKIFNAEWIVDGERSDHRVRVIRNTMRNPPGVAVASDTQRSSRWQAALVRATGGRLRRGDERSTS